jgi:hypothetical protein
MMYYARELSPSNYDVTLNEHILWNECFKFQNVIQDSPLFWHES